MLKPNSLRKAIVASFPGLGKKPDDLTIFMRKGRIVSRDGPHFGFQYRYTVLVELLDFADDPDVLFVTILLWARRHQPDLLQKMDDGAGFRFDADRLSPTSVDIVIELELDESVATTARPGGGLNLVHVTEPQGEDAWNAVLDQDLGRPLLQEIWLGDQRIVPDPAAGDDDG